MYIKYDEVELFEFFECEPTCIGEYVAGNLIYSYQYNDFTIIVVICTYEMYIKISIEYKNSTVYSQKHNGVLEIKRNDSNSLRVLTEKENEIILKKEPQIGVFVEQR